MQGGASQGAGKGVQDRAEKAVMFGRSQRSRGQARGAQPYSSAVTVSLPRFDRRG